MKKMKRLAAMLCCLVLILQFGNAFAATDGFNTSYTYIYDYWEDPQQSPDVYRVLTDIDSLSLGLENLNGIRMNNPDSLFVQGEMLYICDTMNNRIIEVKREGDNFIFSRIIDHFIVSADQSSETQEIKAEESVPETTENLPAEQAIDNSAEEANVPESTEDGNKSEETTEETPADNGTEGEKIDTGFLSPTDVFVDSNGNIYVADSGHERVVMINADMEMVRIYTKPTDATFGSGRFKPLKLVVDVEGRVYVLCDNLNKGLVKYEFDGEFSGFIGANQVNISMGEYIWKRYFQSKEQREKSAKTVPTQFINIDIDDRGFIYATNIATPDNQWDLKSDGVKPIRRISPLGSDILIKNDRNPPIGDLEYTVGSDTNGPSEFIDITVLEDDMYVALDRTRGRLFGYDSQGILLWAFGSKGNVEGAFSVNGTSTWAVSIENMGYDLLVLDKTKGMVTVFTPTEFGQTIYDAAKMYLKGEIDRSAELWQEVLKMNANYPLAFRGIGQAVLLQDKYEEAMEYFKLAHDRESYGRAFKYYRKIWVEKNILWIVLVVAALLIIPLVIGKIKKTKWEVNEYERGKIHK